MGKEGCGGKPQGCPSEARWLVEPSCQMEIKTMNESSECRRCDFWFGQVQSDLPGKPLSGYRASRQQQVLLRLDGNMTSQKDVLTNPWNGRCCLHFGKKSSSMWWRIWRWDLSWRGPDPANTLTSVQRYWFWISGIQNSGRIHFCCLSHHVSGHLSQQPQGRANTVTKKTKGGWRAKQGRKQGQGSKGHPHTSAVHEHVCSPSRLLTVLRLLLIL